MKPFSVLIKPASADCNLKCTYCFYLDHVSMYPDQKVHRMSNETLEALISTYMKTPQPVYSFGWQGGEPTLMGVKFFKKAVELQKKYAPKGATISNAVQTNGTLITDELAAFFYEHKFLIGVSLDGPKEIHDEYRLNLGDVGTHDLVMKGIDILRKHEVEFNILTLVSQSNVKHAKKVYTYLREQGFYFHQYIPCVEFDQDGNKLPFAITGEEWGQFLLEIFNEWKYEDRYKISIRGFDAILSFMILGQMNVCTMGGNCCQYYVVEHNGDVFPCDFFVETKRKLGNITTGSFDQFAKHPQYIEFGIQKHQWNGNCSSCEYIKFCSGDCLKHRIYNEHNPDNMSWLCEGWKYFYKETLDQFRDMGAEFMRNNMQGQQIRFFDQAKIDRNDKCYCGSQQKYKFCHGRNS